MSADRVAAIAGVAESDLGEVAPKTALQLQAEAARDALADAGLTFADVDGLLSAGGETFAPSMAIGEYLGIRPPALHRQHQHRRLVVRRARRSRVLRHRGRAVPGGADHLRLDPALRERAEPGPRRRRAGPDQFERVWGMPAPVGAYALAATRHMHQYGTTAEQLAEVAVATRAWAALNPKAFMRDPITIEDVLSSRWISEPLHLLDCCLVTDGGGAVVIVSAERARDLPRPPVWILGHGESHTHLGISSMPDLTTTPAVHSGAAAFGMAGLSPVDVDVAEVYDSFTITVLLTLEALGFCGRGESGGFVSGQRTAPGGDFPLNTNGGGLSYCHPGMYGIFTLIEATRQLRDESGPRQVPGARVAIANGTGGVLSSAATVLLGRD